MIRVFFFDIIVGYNPILKMGSHNDQITFDEAMQSGKEEHGKWYCGHDTGLCLSPPPWRFRYPPLEVRNAACAPKNRARMCTFLLER